MAEYLITGGKPLRGSVKIYGAKNAAFKLMLAAALSDKACKIQNICYIRDVITVKRLLEKLGAKVEFCEDKNLSIDAKGLVSWEVPIEFGQESRASSMILPVLLHRFGKAKAPFPGGDNIGARSLDRHLDGLKTLGAEITVDEGFIKASTSGGLRGATYCFPKNTHTGTETMVMAAVLAKGTTVLENAAQEPEINDLINFLNKIGAKIHRESNRKIVIDGVEKLSGGNWAVMADRNEAVTFACAALATKGDIFVEGARADHLQAFLDKVSQAGGGYETGEGGIRVFYQGGLVSTEVETDPYPGFMTDWQALWVTLMTQAKGTSLVHEKVFENRLGYVEFLKQMGASIDLFNPVVENPEAFYNFNLSDKNEDSFHAVRVTGPTPLKAIKLEVKDIRAGATLTLAALVAEGQSVISNVELIERGYENLEGRLEALGAKIIKRD